MDYDLHQLAGEVKLDQVPERVLMLETMLEKNNYGNTPLHWAAMDGLLHLVPGRLLTLETMLVKDNKGMAVLHLFAERGHLDLLLGIDFGERVKNSKKL